eukprot:727381-Prorocentrum_minimum.AAC.1
MFAAQWYHFAEPRNWVTSGGLGSMGFGLPSAIGAAVARPDELVVDIDGDGSFVMNVQVTTTYLGCRRYSCALVGTGGRH